MIKKINLEELTFDNIGAWPMFVKVATGILINLLLCVVVYEYVLQAQIQKWSELQIKSMRLQQTLVQQQQQLNQRARYEKQLKKLQQSWVVNAQHLLSANQVADSLAEINKIGIASGLQFKSIRPLSEQQLNVLSVLPVEIDVEGDYPQLTQFLLRLSKLNNFVGLADFVLAVDHTERLRKLALLLTINIYRVEDNKNSIESSIGTTTQARNPFQSDANLAGMEALTAFAIDVLQMVGYLQQGEKQWVLLVAPNGHVYHVTVGTEVGRHHGKVTQVNKDSIEIIEQEMGESKSLILKLRK